MDHYDRNGRAISQAEWMERFNDRVYVRIGATELRAGRNPEVRIRVSTIWTGIDTGNRDIFETLVDRDGKPIETVRYRTEEQAKDGHNEMVGKHIFTDGLPGPKMVREIPAEET